MSPPPSASPGAFSFSPSPVLSEGALIRWGRRVGETVAVPAFLGLRGPLGAGKSVLARAVARGAGIEGTLPSPTYNLLFRYPSPRGITVVHLDLYRLEGPEELWELGWEEIPAPDEVALVEWPERAGAHLPADRWEVRLEIPGEGSDLRKVSLRRFGAPPDLPGLPDGGEVGEKAGLRQPEEPAPGPDPEGER